MPDQKLPKKELIHSLESTKEKSNPNNSMLKPMLFTIIIVVILGIGTGYIASNVSGIGDKGPGSIKGDVVSKEIKKGFITGVDDTKLFPNTAEGTLKEGGIEGEGEFHLERPGGDSQNVYLTSSTVDLSQFVGKKIKVWGKTYDAQSAGWLMDAGKVEVKQ